MGGQGDAQTRLCASCRAAKAHEWLAEERAPSEIVNDRGLFSSVRSHKADLTLVAVHEGVMIVASLFARATVPDAAASLRNSYEDAEQHARRAPRQYRRPERRVLGLDELDAIGPVVILNFLLRSHLLALVAHAGATR